MFTFLVEGVKRDLLADSICYLVSIVRIYTFLGVYIYLEKEIKKRNTVADQRCGKTMN